MVEVGVVDEDSAVAAASLGFDFPPDQIGIGTVATFLCCQALFRGDGPRHSLHALA